MTDPSDISAIGNARESGIRIVRRTLLQGAAAAMVSAKSGFAESQTGGVLVASQSAPYLIARAGFAGAETTFGKVAGYQRRGIFTFKGIPYASARRFGEPGPYQAWGGVRSTKQYGPVCPQAPRGDWIFDDVAWVYNWDDGHADEDCLNLNIWTPGIADGHKRPVMVWLHGGGFQSGSSHELKAYEGENLSRRGDVVVISLNHRVGVLGFLGVAGSPGEEPIARANLGLLDIVAALRWVRENAAAFGGDPTNVTLFGQSGGGGKINALLAMPAAHGLFRRAIMQSAAFPSYRHMATPDISARLAGETLGNLGIVPTALAKLREVPIDRLIKAGMDARKALAVPWKPDIIDPSLSWAPTVDGDVLPEGPFATAAPAISKEVPLLLGTVQNEFSPALYDASQAGLTRDDLRKRVAALHGDRADHVIDAFRTAHPQAAPIELLSLISSAVFRQSVLEQAAMKSAQGGAPAWLYLFTWKTPVLDGRPGAFHCSDLPFMFDNTDVAETMTGGGPGPRALAEKMSTAWISFAYGAPPGLQGLPGWAPFTPSGRETMIIDDSPNLRRNLDDLELASLG